MTEESKAQNLSEFTSAVVPDKTLNEVVPDTPAKNLSEFTTAVPKRGTKVTKLPKKGLTLDEI